MTDVIFCPFIPVLIEAKIVNTLDQLEKIVVRSMPLFVIIAVVAGCSTQLTPEAKKVRQIAATSSSGCSFLGAVSASESLGLDIAGDTESAFNKMRNQVAALGGDAFVLTNSTSSFDSTNVQADAYACG